MILVQIYIKYSIAVISIYIIQSIHAGRISLTPPRARHWMLRKLLWRKLVTLTSACLGRNYNFRCINVVFCVFLRESAHTAANSQTNLSLRRPLLDVRWRQWSTFTFMRPLASPGASRNSKCQKWSVSRSVKSTAEYLTSVFIPSSTIIPRVKPLPALQFQTLEQKTTPDANRSEERLPVPVPGVWEWRVSITAFWIIRSLQ